MAGLNPGVFPHKMRQKKNDFTMIYSKLRVYSLLFRSIMKNTVEN